MRQYEIIAGISNRMLAEARADNWDAVVALGEQYQDAVESLRAIAALSDEDREARRDLLTKILDDDAKIRMLATPELGRLSMLLGNMKRQQSVLHAYSSNAV
ncbi:flagellar protein FliT [Pollutimonas subterranea]|uniref:flagellar protein FliT n=1 Tax=Pollutimonas subterranea TaxID=2045210 RepID=UPI001E39B412|nr:flagellar protein FliT [Pollutimonas subterranea]